MKRWRRFFQSFILRHIVGPEPVAVPEAPVKPPASADMIRFSVWHHLRGAKKQQPFLLDYAATDAKVINELRLDGYSIQLHAGPDGTLAYMISPGVFPSFS